jgi:hypothetical protein
MFVDAWLEGLCEAQTHIKAMRQQARPLSFVKVPALRMSTKLPHDAPDGRRGTIFSPPNGLRRRTAGGLRNRSPAQDTGFGLKDEKIP